MRYFGPLVLGVLIAALPALADEAVKDADKATLAALTERGVRVVNRAAVDYRADARIEFVAVEFDKKSWAASAELLPTLGAVRQNLSLEFTNVRLRDDDLASLRDWENVLFLTLKGCDVTDMGLSYILALPRLRFLSLMGKTFTAGAIEPLVGCKTLQGLSLTGRNFTDECVPELMQLGGLAQLRLERHGLTEAGVAKLNQAIPSVELTLREPDFPGPRWQLDRSKNFVYLLPREWLKTNHRGVSHDVILLPQKTDRKPNIVISDQPGASTLSDLKSKYERDLPKALKDFKLESSELISTEDGGEMVKLIHENSTPGIVVRQINYIVQVGKHWLCIACTVTAEDGNRYDQQFDAFARSIGKPPHVAAADKSASQ